MTTPKESAVDWRAVADGLAEDLGVQVGGSFAYVSEAMASRTGWEADRLTGAPWHRFFGPEKRTRLASDAVETARREGRWDGVVRVESGGEGADAARLGLSLIAVGDDTLLWEFSDPDPPAESETTPDSDVTDGNPEEWPLDGRHGFVETLVDALDDILYVVDENREFVFWNRELPDRLGYTDEEVANLDPMALLEPDSVDELPVDSRNVVDIPEHNVVELLTKGGEAITHELYGVTYTDERTGDRYRVGIARDFTEHRRQKRALERQRDELATLDRINRLLLETIQALIETSSRDAVERTICERLAAVDRYRFTWVGERAFDGDRIVPRVVAGEDDGYVSAVRITDDDTGMGRGPAGRAMATGKAQAVTVDDPAFDPWRAAAVERGIEAVAAVPLQHDGAVYGVLMVYSTRADAFNPREQAGFEVLGRTVGSVIHAARSRDLLFADAVSELEFDLSDSRAIIPRTARDLDCHLELDGYVTTGEQWFLYLSVVGAEPAAVAESLADDSRVERARVVGGTEDDGRIEVCIGRTSLIQTVIGSGGAITTATATPGGARLVVEVPIDADVPDIVSRIQRTYPDAEFRANRERDREVTPVGRPDGLIDELTDRQREVLEVAYRAGYFAWPRESTAEELAEVLDIAAPTLHGHLRKAEESVFGTLFDADR